MRNCFLFLCSTLVCLQLHSQHHTTSTIKEAISLYQNGNYVSAVILIENVLEKRPEAELYELKAQIEKSGSLLQQSLQSYTRAIELSEDRWDLFFSRGLIYYDLGIYTKAIDDFDDFLQEGDGQTTAVFFRTDLNDEEPLQIKSSNTVVSDALMYRGLSYQAIDSLDLAARDLMDACRLDSSAQLFLNLGLVRLDQGDSVAARSIIASSVSIDPTYTLGWYNLKLVDPSVQIPPSVASSTQIFPMLQYRALEALESGQFTLAGQLIEELIRLYPDRFENYELAGRLAYERGDFESAAIHYHAGLKGAPEASIFHNLLGNTYFQLKDFQAAVSYYELVLAGDPQNAPVGFNAAVAYHRLGDRANMCRCMRNLQGANFSNPQIEMMENLCQ